MSDQMPAQSYASSAAASSAYRPVSHSEEAPDVCETESDARDHQLRKPKSGLNIPTEFTLDLTDERKIPRTTVQSGLLDLSPTQTYELDESKTETRNALQGQAESGLESRFNASSGMPVAIGMDETGSPLDEPPPATSKSNRFFESSANRSGGASEDPPDNSPYPQVRASVSPHDDVSLSINTPRMWTLSLLFSILGSATNLFFSLRFPSVTITPVVALLLVHPLGRLWDTLLKREDDPTEAFVDGRLAERHFTVHVLETEVFSTSSNPSLGSRRRSSTTYWASMGTKFRLWLAQGRWNQKEHACVYIASNVAFGFAFATDVIVEQTQFYLQEAPILYQILLVLSTQILGYSAAGITRRYLVRPSGMIWPSTLMSTSMFSTLHRDENKPANGWRISRWRFFLAVFLGSFAWYFLPGFLATALSHFNAITWFAPDNVVVANLFGVSSGLGLFPLTFDWSQIAYIGSPLVVPFWAAMNVVGGLVIVMWIIAPICYYANVLYTSYLPILSSSVFDNTGKVYDVTRILTPEFLFDEEAYQSYSPVFLPITYVLSYAVQFASLTALLTHTICWHGRDIWKQGRHAWTEAHQDWQKKGYTPLSADDPPPPPSTRKPTVQRQDSGSSTERLLAPDLHRIMDAEDVHSRLMRRYKDVPISWYLLTGLINLAVGIFVVEYYPIHLPWYGLLLAFFICALLFIPIGIVMAITNQQSSIYLICQIVCGVIFPGRPVANMVFVTYGYITSTQGLKFSSDLKLGQYMKIPPRILFSLQLVATTVSSLTQISVLNWSLQKIPGICTAEALNGFSCPIARVHFNGSILWGVVGPSRFFGSGALYQPLVWAFLLGIIAPLLVWYFGRNKGQDGVWQRVNLPVIFGSLSWIPPATGLNFSVWALVCLVFNSIIRKSKESWWRKYNMTLSAALDAGAAFGVGVVFFALLYPGWNWVENFQWWGTEVYKRGCDWRACPYKSSLPESGKFGPEHWQ